MLNRVGRINAGAKIRTETTQAQNKRIALEKKYFNILNGRLSSVMKNRNIVVTGSLRSKGVLELE